MAQTNKKIGNKNALKWTEEKAIELGKRILKWILPEIGENKKDKHADNVFYLKYICEEEGFHKDTINYLKKKYVSFSELIKRINTIQEMKIAEGGLIGKFNPALSIFCLKNNHGWRDRIEHIGDNENPLSVTVNYIK